MAGAILNLTENAQARVAHPMAQKPDAAGIRVWIKEAGCSGLAYQVDFADDVPEGDDVVETPGGKVFIDPKAIMYILGSTMDFQEDKFFSGFLFSNPNETDRCGCGESFSVGGAEEATLKDPAPA
jgi:iron-sulfur cluster assembly protein